MSNKKREAQQLLTCFMNFSRDVLILETTREEKREAIDEATTKLFLDLQEIGAPIVVTQTKEQTFRKLTVQQLETSWKIENLLSTILPEGAF